jgi:hypothetical protein
LPEPLEQTRITFSRRSIESHLISSRISGLFTEAAVKSNVSSAFSSTVLLVSSFFMAPPPPHAPRV